ncbi:polyketide synthase [Bacillus subtilis]|nr:polyketide synthase [Bacillus subtilis]
MEDLKEKQILCQLLPVSYAFHSSLIDPAESAYAEFLRSKIFSKTVNNDCIELNGKLPSRNGREFLLECGQKANDVS